VKFVLNSLSHYDFQQHLKHKCEEYGCKLIIGKEEYTSQMCGNCGNLEKKYKNRIKECNKCGYKMNRDRPWSKKYPDSKHEANHEIGRPSAETASTSCKCRCLIN